MITIGLTGSIGMGKSTTSNMFKEAGCPVFDADSEVHSLYAEGGKAVPIIRAVFPDAIKNGAVDRPRLAEYMREDPLHLPVLESFIHPLVGQARAEFLEQAKIDKADIVIMDVPLLFETGGDSHVDKVIVVTAPKSVQRERVMARPGMTAELFNSLLARQMLDADKRKRADILIYTDKGLESAREQVQKILTELRGN